MKVFGMDPGVKNVGWAVVEEGVVDFGVFDPSSQAVAFNDKLNEEMVSSVRFFREKLQEVDAVAWEIVPSFGGMSQRDRVVGVASALKFVTWELGLPWVGRAPATIKKLATGNGKATKAEMKAEVFRRYPDTPVVKKMPVDAYDAIMIASVAQREGVWSDVRF